MQESLFVLFVLTGSTAKAQTKEHRAISALECSVLAKRNKMDGESLRLFEHAAENVPPDPPGTADREGGVRMESPDFLLGFFLLCYITECSPNS